MLHTFTLQERTNTVSFLFRGLWIRQVGSSDFQTFRLSCFSHFIHYSINWVLIIKLKDKNSNNNNNNNISKSWIKIGGLRALTTSYCSHLSEKIRHPIHYKWELCGSDGIRSTTDERGVESTASDPLHTRWMFATTTSDRLHTRRMWHPRHSIHYTREAGVWHLGHLTHNTQEGCDINHYL